MTHVFDNDAPILGFSSFPSHIQVFDNDVPVFGLISLPSKIQVFDNEAPDFGFNSVPSHTHLLGNSILFDIFFPLFYGKGARLRKYEDISIICNHFSSIDKLMYGIEILNESSLEGWGEIFEFWNKEIQKTVGLTSGNDAPYVHAEHGNTHLFGVAASMAGYATLREVMGSRNGNSARLDLCLVSEEYLDIVEAKWLEFDVSCSPPLERISDQVKNACNDSRSYANSEKLFSIEDKVIRKTGITFVTPHLNSEMLFDENKFISLINAIKNRVQPDLLAWSFPVQTREMLYWKRRYPGVIAIAKRTD